MQNKIVSLFQESIAVKKAFIKDNVKLIEEVSQVIANAFNEGKKLLIFGNGGSACDSSHITAEFVNRFKKERPGLPAISLNTDIAILTAISNDYDFSEVFARQIKTLGQKDDIAIAISTSGASKNVLKAVTAAKKKGLKTLAFTGAKGEKLASMCDYAFVVPSNDTPRIQETHITIAHVVCQLVEDILFEFPEK